MSTTQTPAGSARPAQPANVSATQPATPQVQQTAQELNRAADAMKTPQQRLDAQTASTNESRAKAEQVEAKRREDLIRAHQKQQQAINNANVTAIKSGDFVVIDLDQVPQELHTVAMRDSLRDLRQAGAHLISGRVQDVQDSPTGRQYVVETPNRNYTVPAAAVTRADLYELD